MNEEIRPGRIAISALFAFPVELAFFIFAIFTTYRLYFFWHDLFWEYFGEYETILISNRYFAHFWVFFEHWHIALGIHAMNMILYAFCWSFFNIKLKYEVLTLSVVAFIISVIITSGNRFFAGDRYFGYSFLFSTIMFSIFVLLINRFDKNKKMHDVKRRLVIPLLSIVLGGVLSYIVLII